MFIVPGLIGADNRVRLSFAPGDLSGVRVSAAGEDLDLLDFEHLFRSDDHRMQQVAIVRDVVDLLVDDEAALHLNDALQVIRGQHRRLGVAHLFGLGLAEDEHLLPALL